MPKDDPPMKEPKEPKENLGKQAREGMERQGRGEPGNKHEADQMKEIDPKP